MNVKRFSRQSDLTAWVLLIILSLIWGSSYILIKRGLDVYTPEQVGTMRLTFAFLILLPTALKNVFRLPGNKLLVLFLIGLVGNILPYLLFSYAQTVLASSVTGILNALTPIFAMLIAVFIFKYKIRGMQIAGMLLGFSGILLLSFIDETGVLGSINIYVWLVIIATLCYAVSLNLIKAYLSDIRSVIVSAVSLLSVGPICMAYLFTTDFIHRFNTVPGSGMSMLYIAILGIVGTAFAMILYTKLIQITDAIFATTVTYMLPIVSIIWGLLDGEILYPVHYAGMLIILSGVYLINKNFNINKSKA
ncbi:MAG TPA: DMT family transporter [Ignavibacteria bacterium]|nr:EamA family transporter [Bacteroidota bacterium]HRI85278.1 DMT family transporter [Ignavibacteria bacterium]HRK00624.1 DMT family transporter [Ignavibacteria bacterium]